MIDPLGKQNYCGLVGPGVIRNNCITQLTSSQQEIEKINKL